MMHTHLARRFKQLHAVLVSNHNAAAAAGQRLGFLRAAPLSTACAGLEASHKQQTLQLGLPSPATVAACTATTLGAHAYTQHVCALSFSNSPS